MKKRLNKILARILVVIMGTNMLPASNLNLFAQPIATQGGSIDRIPESIYGPYNGEVEGVHAVERFKEPISLEGTQYTPDTVLIKVENNPSFFGFGPSEPQTISHSAIINVEPIQLSTQAVGISDYSQEDSTWYRAHLVSGSDVETVINELNQDDDIIVAEPEYIRQLESETLEELQPIEVQELQNVQDLQDLQDLQDEALDEQWYLDAINIVEARKHLEELGINPGGSRDVVVAVIDTGVDYTHPDLAANMWTNPMEIPGNNIDDDGNGYIDDVHGISTVAGERSGNPMDDNGHGTHVAGIIAAQANNGIGGVGVAYNVQIMAIKAAQSSGVLTSTDIAKAIIYAAENGADVINMSYGGTGRSILEEDALAMAYSTSVLVAAAGNDGKANEVTVDTPFGAPTYPASYPWVLGIMASSDVPDGNGDWLASFSNWDIISENSREYEIMAPGKKIFSTLPGDQYAKWDGTSMAAPVVSGIAALVRSKYTDKESYSSRFIMGQLVSTGNVKQGKTYSAYDLPKTYKEVDAFNALTNTPKPKVTYMEHYLFDKMEGSTTSGDGIVDAGETVDIGMIIRNHWGKAEDVTVTIDTLSQAGIPDPYVELTNDTVNYGAIGNFGTDDNGFIYDNEGMVVGVKNPFSLHIKPDTPNDHVVSIHLTITARNGFDSGDTTLYTTEDTISFTVRKGTVLPDVIDQDMTLTKDHYWIIPNATIIEKGVTVTVEPGTQIQFWSSEEEGPYGEKAMAYLQVEGDFIARGTAEEPIEMFNSPMWPGYEVKIYSTPTFDIYGYSQKNYIGNIELSYVNIMNPHINVNQIDHCYFTQDLFDKIYKRYLSNGQVATEYWYGPRVNAEVIQNSQFYKLGYKNYEADSSGSFQIDGKLMSNLFDNCVYYFDEQVAQNNVFLNNYKLNKEQYGDREYWTSQGKFATSYDKDSVIKTSEPIKFNYTGSSYISVSMNALNSDVFSRQYLFNTVEKFAQSLGGHIVTINNEQENQFLTSTVLAQLEKDYPWQSNKGIVIGLSRQEAELPFTWVSGEANDYLNLAQSEESKDFYLLKGDGKWYNSDLIIEDNPYISPIFVIEVPGTAEMEYITLNHTQLDLGENGAPYQLVASIYPPSVANQTITWVSSNPEVAAVDETGKVTPHHIGVATITATSVATGMTASCQVTVREIVPVTGIELSKIALNIERGKTAQIEVNILPLSATDKRITWHSSDETVVSVDNTGKLTAKKLGKATITVTTLDGGFTATCQVQVIVPVTGITVKDSFIRTVVGESVQINAKVAPAEATIQDIIYTSSDEEVGVVNESGLVTGIKPGTIMVTAKTKDGNFSKSVTITIWDKAYDFSPLKVETNNYNTAILNQDGTVWLTGQSSKTTPVLVPLSIKAKDIGFKNDYSSSFYILDEQGDVWEASTEGYLNKVSELTQVKQIAVGYNYLLTLKEDGTVWAKGQNDNGQLGDGSKEERYQIVQTEGLSGIIEIAAGNYSSMAVKKDGTLWVWGSNNFGQLGLGDTVDRLLPVQVPNITQAKAIGVGATVSFYIDQNNKLYASGYTYISSSTHYTYVADNVRRVESAYYNMLYLTNQGELYVGGYNGHGQLGIGHTDSAEIQKNPYLNDVTFISTSEYFTVVVKKDGTVWAMGNNDYGQLGNMTTTTSTMPVQMLLGILPDEIKPSVIATEPKKGNSSNSLTPTVKISFNETVKTSSNYSYIRLKDSEGDIISLTNKNLVGKTLSFEPTRPLASGKNYIVEVPSGAVVDMFGNPNEAYSFSFTTPSEDRSTTEVYGVAIAEDITEEQITALKDTFLKTAPFAAIKNNAILNRWWDLDVSRWMRFTAPEGSNKNLIYINENYWGTTSSTLIEKAIIHNNDYKTLAKVIADPILTEAPESAYPFITDLYITNREGIRVEQVGAERVKVNILFNRDMNTDVQPNVTFGPDMPTTDYRITAVDGGWESSRKWVGEVNITPITGDGYQFFKVVGAQTAEDAWLTTGNDQERFRFEIITSGTESMNLQAEGKGNHIKLSWFQDDFDTLAGYNIYRAEEEDGWYEKINPYIIPAHIKSYSDAAVEPGKTYYYKFTVLQTNMTESDYSNMASGAALDSIPPVINHTPIQSGIVARPIRITANVTDNIMVKTVTLYYKEVGAEHYIAKEMINTEDAKYTAVIEASNVTAKGIAYYIEATDGLNVARSGMPEAPYIVQVGDYPRITSLSPVEGPDVGGTRVTISGSNFKEGVKVTFDHLLATNVVVESSTQITAYTPSHSAGYADVKVENADGYSDTLYRGFTYKKDGINLAVGRVQGKKGEIIEVPLYVDYIDGLRSGEMKFNYDATVLEFLEVRPGELTAEFMVSANEVTAGSVSLAMAGAEEANGSGNIAYIKMRVLNAPSKEACTLTLSEVELNGGNIVAAISGGQFNLLVGYCVYGNVYYYMNYVGINNAQVKLENEQGYYEAVSKNGTYNIADVYKGTYKLSALKMDEVKDITAYDASLVLQAALQMRTLTSDQMIAADVNGDAKVNALDAAHILAYSAGKLVLPFPGNSDIWKFRPINGNVNVTQNDNYDNNLYGILIGDVSGNWGTIQDPSIQQGKATFNLGAVYDNGDGTVTMPIEVDMMNASLYGTDLTIHYDINNCSLLEAEKTTDIQEFGAEVNTSVPGEVKIALASATAYRSSGKIINLIFKTNNPQVLAATTYIKDVKVNEDNVKAVIYNSKDINGDSIVDDTDFDQLVNELNKTEMDSDWNEALDINKDGVIDIFDMILISKDMN